MNTNLKLLYILATDGIVLPALWYSKKNKRLSLSIYVHGSGSSSIINNPDYFNKLAKELASKEVDFLAFNNRGAGYYTKLRHKSPTSQEVQFGGMAFDRINHSLYDIEGVLKWAKSIGYEDIYLIGHSTGANKLCYYLSTGKVPNTIKRVYLLAGGDDIGLQRGKLSNPEKVADILNAAIKEGKIDELVPPTLFPGQHPISYGSFYELITRGSDYDIFPFERIVKQDDDSDLFGYFKSIQIPITAIYGSDDQGTIIPVKDAVSILERLNRLSRGYIITGAGHNFVDHEDQLIDEIVTNLG